MEISEIARLAGEFQLALDAAKARIQPAVFDWYRYDSLGNFFTLDEVLTGERRNLIELTGGDPVLDIGCGDGDAAFFLESLSCRVDALDNELTNHNGMRGVRAMKAALSSGVDIYSADLDGACRLPAPRYGLALLLGVLYHLKNPFLALETIARQARHCILSTRIGARTPDGAIDFYDAPLTYLLGPEEANADATNYWIFSNASLRRLLERTHWEILDYKVFGDVPGSGPADHQFDLRVFCCLRSRLFDSLGEGRPLEGWHGIEANSWRWTERRFSVEFPNPPPRGVLTLRFALPEVVIGILGSFTLRATVNGLPLPEVTYTESGEHVYTSRIDLEGPATVIFEAAKALPPQPPDVRELSLMAVSVTISPA